VDDPDFHDLVAAYALSALDERDRHRFEAHLTRCERCKSELPDLEAAATELALDVDVSEPPGGLRDRILASARDDRGTAGKAMPLRRRWWVLPASVGAAAAAASAAVGVGIWAVALSHDLDREQSARRVDGRAVAVLSDPTAVRYPLVGTPGLLAVTRSRDAALVVSNLRRAARGKTYELWVVVSLQPQPAGIFSGGEKRALVPLTRKVPHDARVSVTLEPAGGSRRVTGSVLFGTQTT
jgi:anti-sigma-K factor RskA